MHRTATWIVLLVLATVPAIVAQQPPPAASPDQVIHARRLIDGTSRTVRDIAERTRVRFVMKGGVVHTHGSTGVPAGTVQ